MTDSQDGNEAGRMTEPGWYGPGRYVADEEDATSVGTGWYGPGPGAGWYGSGSGAGAGPDPGSSWSGWQATPSGGPPGWRPPPAAGYGYGAGYGAGYGYGQAAGSWYPYHYTHPVWRRRTDGMAVAALVLGVASVLVGWFTLIVPLLAVVFGLVALPRIRNSADRPEGHGMAVAGIVLGAIGLLASVVFWIAVVVGASSCSHSGGCNSNGVVTPPPPAVASVQTG